MIISGPNGKIKCYSDEPYSDHGYDDSYGEYYGHYFTYPLYANQLDEKITVKFIKGSQSVKFKVGEKNVKSYSYKANDYLDSLIDGEYSDEAKNAAKSLKNLGLAAENYFDNGSYDIDFLDSDYDLDEFEPGSSDDVKYSLVLDSKLAARVYIPDLPADAEYEGLQAVAGKNGLNCFEI